MAAEMKTCGECRKLSVKDKNAKFLENQNCLALHRLPARSVLIPATEKGVYYRNKETSPLLQSLNGDYRFRYCESDSIEDFSRVSFSDDEWDVINVPSMWQYRGYGNCAYPNIEYPIPFDPPFVRCKNPVGYYRRTFGIGTLPARAILHFGGVDNAFFVYLNGVFVGFSKGSRIPAEFDVASFLTVGENTLAVKVFTYSDATYLENQDMLLASGIFRDVYLLSLGEVNLWDYRVTTTENSFCIDAQFDFHGECGYTVRFELDGERYETAVAKDVSHTFVLSDPHPWNAEEPNLYDLYITLLKNGTPVEVHSKRVGMIRTEVKGTRFLVNGKPIYIKGINRHEYDDKNGRAISVPLIERELKMIKANNLNAVRCSHYTNHPAFYEIAAELGIYVLDEADMETHGCWVTGDQGYLSKDPTWFPAYFDRVSRMVAVNKNEPCIFMWSIGNECGRGENLDRCFDYVRAFDPTREVIHTQEEPYHPTRSRFCRVGYPDMAKIESFRDTGKPLLLIEYAHAMGNGAGHLNVYWDYIYSHQNMCGGFVWEFKSHGFYAKDAAGREYHRYGNDFGDSEKYHWYNFCLDGYLTSDGTPKPTWYELGEVLAPVVATYRDGVRLLNTNDFRDASYLTVRWELLRDTERVESGTFDMPPLRPHESVTLPLDKLGIPSYESVAGAVYRLDLSFFDGATRVSSAQLTLPSAKEREIARRAPFPRDIETEGSRVTLRGKRFEVTVEDGMLSRFLHDGRELLRSPMRVNFWRAPIDNDGVMPMLPWFPTWFRRRLGEWTQAYLNTMKFHCDDTEVRALEDRVIVTSRGKILPDYEWLGFDALTEYEIYADGTVSVTLEGHPFGKLPEVLPRMGLTFALARENRYVGWYGRGPRQSYIDSKTAAPFGYYENTVENLNFHFDFPQETGNHTETAFLNIGNGRGGGLTVIGCDSFDFSYHDFSLKNLCEARHANELLPSEENYLYLDYAMRALGSRSCGPEPEAAYELYPHAFRFTFLLCPYLKKEQALASWRQGKEKKSGRLSENYRYCERKEEKEIADCKE